MDWGFLSGKDIAGFIADTLTALSIFTALAVYVYKKNLQSPRAEALIKKI